MRYSGVLGIATEQQVRPGIWEKVVTEQKVLGTVEQGTETHALDDEIHPTISSTRSVSVPARGLGQMDNSKILYASYAGKNWTITSVVDQFPQIVCYFGEEYHGPVPE